MIDWQNVNIDDFKLRVLVEGIEESGNNIIFPVRVCYQDGTEAFVKSIPIRTEFYEALKKMPDYKEALMKIFTQRVRDDLHQRIQPQVMAIKDKMDFINTDEQPV